MSARDRRGGLLAGFGRLGTTAEASLHVLRSLSQACRIMGQKNTSEYRTIKLA
jgi:hypothetical protein